MTAPLTRRTSDRWLTPGVVVVLVLAAALVLLGVIAAMTYLTALGRDPDPVLRLALEALGTVALVVNLLLTLAQRSGVAKVERKAGLLEVAVGDALDELDARTGRHTEAPASMTEYRPPMLPPVPDATRPHPFGGQSAAPVSGRE